MSPGPNPFVAGPLVLLVCSACSSPGGVAFDGTPAVPLTVTVTSDPPVRADGTVPRDARFWVTLDDDYPDPDSIGYGPLTLRSGQVSFDFSWTVELVDHRILVTPRALLLPGARYNVVVTSLTALDGRQLGAAGAVGTFTAGSDTPGRPAAAATPTWNGAIAAVLGDCAPVCHSPAGPGGVPIRALDLTGDPRNSTFGLIGVPAASGVGTAYPILRVAPGDPARSLLLRKLIGGNPRADSRDPAYPNMAIDGRRMPIPLDPGAPVLAPLPDDTLRQIQAWIAGGTPLD
jgi:hypothetical protein